MDWVAFDSDCWCVGVTVVTNSIYVGPNALEGCVFVGGGLENCLKLGGQGNSLNE